MARKRKRSSFVITIASAAAASVACGGSTRSDLTGSGATSGSGGAGAVSGSGGSGASSGSGGTGNVSGSGGAPGCPASFPANEGPCSLPDGTTCKYDQGQCCPDWGATCIDGKWQAFGGSCNPPPPDPCPETVPSAGWPCGSADPCGNNYQYCTYGKCSDGAAATIAECNGGTWDLKTQCTPAPCKDLSPCECFDRADCKAVTDTCICDCDYKCPGKPPCDCICGGGKFLGCAPVGG